MRAKRSRPAANRAATKEHSGGKFNGPSSIAQAADILARARRTDYVLRVRAQRRDGIVVVQHYVSLDAAQRKVRRVRDAGLLADITLCRVTPVIGSVELGDAL